MNTIIAIGEGYRKGQLRGYQQYERFLSRIVNDTSVFVDRRNLEIWLSRNLPRVYAFRTDSSYVSDEQFQSFRLLMAICLSVRQSGTLLTFQRQPMKTV